MKTNNNEVSMIRVIFTTAELTFAGILGYRWGKWMADKTTSMAKVAHTSLMTKVDKKIESAINKIKTEHAKHYEQMHELCNEKEEGESDS